MYTDLVDKFKVKVGDKSIYVWHSRKFEELAYMNIPRALFLVGSIFIIYQITLRQQQAK